MEQKGWKGSLKKYFEESMAQVEDVKIGVDNFTKDLIESSYKIRSMTGYVFERLTDKCGSPLRLNRPSKRLMKRYNLSYDSNDLFIWWLMEQYFDGKLVEKQKEEQK